MAYISIKPVKNDRGSGTSWTRKATTEMGSLNFTDNITHYISSRINSQVLPVYRVMTHQDNKKLNGACISLPEERRLNRKKSK